MEQDATLDNLRHPQGYRTGAWGELGRVTEVGTGPKPMILIAGAGFGGEIFDPEDVIGQLKALSIRTAGADLEAFAEHNL